MELRLLQLSLLASRNLQRESSNAGASRHQH
jgi:hypothetical protein